MIRRKIPLAAAVSASLFIASAAQAGLPQPGILLYGKVTSNGQLITDGQLAISYTPANGTPIDFSVQLIPFNGSGEQYSYSILLPVEQTITGSPNRIGALSLREQPTFFTRSFRFGGEELQLDTSQLGTQFSLSVNSHVGYVERVDLVTPPDPESCCPGDGDHNNFVNSDDYRSVRDNFGDPTPSSGDADCSGFVNTLDYLAVRNHFGQSCTDDRAVREDFDWRYKTRLDTNAHLHAVAPQEPVPLEEPFTVRVRLDSGVYGAQVAGAFLQYDPAMLRFDGGRIASAQFDSVLFRSQPRSHIPGTVSFSAGASQPLLGSDILMAELEFTPIQEGTTELHFAFGGERLTMAMDENMQPVTTTSTGARVTIGRSVPPINEGYIIF